MRVLAKTLTGDILPMNIEPGDTIEHLKQLIYQQTDKDNDMFEINLTHAGQQLENGNTLSESHVEPDDTVEVVIHESNDLVLPVRLMCLGTNSFTLYVKTSYTVKHLKKLVSYRGVPLLRLLINSAELKGKNTLADYNVQKNDKIYVVLNIDGGGVPISRFFFGGDLSKPFTVRKPSPTSPSYAQFNNGVSSEGRCVNPACFVYGHQFLCHHGYGVYRVNEHPTRCPECQGKSPRVDSFGMCRANVLIRAMPLGLRTQEVEICCDLSEEDGDYSCVPPSILDSHYECREYEFIEVLSSKPDCPISMDWDLCSVCFRILSESNECSHGHVALGL